MARIRFLRFATMSESVSKTAISRYTLRIIVLIRYESRPLAGFARPSNDVIRLVVACGRRLPASCDNAPHGRAARATAGATDLPAQGHPPAGRQDVVRPLRGR